MASETAPSDDDRLPAASAPALIAVGADITQSPTGGLSRFLGIVGVALASVNIFGGVLVTQRMLAMYKKKGS